jgi:hypothetical protein
LRAASLAALDGEIAELVLHGQTPDTGRHTRLFAAACALGRHVAAGGLAEAEARSALQDAASQLGLPDDSERAHQIDHGLAEGTKEPYRLRDRVPTVPPPRGWHLGTPPENGSTKPDLGVPTGGTLVAPSGTPQQPVGERGANPTHTPQKLRVLDVELMLTTTPPPVPWVVNPFLVASCVTMLAGREGQGKSMLALALGAAIGHGADLAGLECEHGTVLYIDAENGEREAHRRVHGLGVRPGTLTYVEAQGFNLAADMPLVDEFVLQHKPTVLVLDSLRSLAPGLDENDSKAAEAALRPVSRLSQTRGLPVLVLHHAGKNGFEYRGSTAIGAAGVLEVPSGARAQTAVAVARRRGRPGAYRAGRAVSLGRREAR